MNNKEIYLKENIIRFTYLSCAILNDNIEILEAEDTFGGYYEKKIMLPNKINISKSYEINLYIYIYKILFLSISKKLNFYLPKNKNNLDYIILSTILIEKTISKFIKNTYKNIINIIKLIYPVTNKKRSNIKDLKERELLIEILIKKLTYDRIKHKIILTKEEKVWIYLIENQKKLNSKNLEKILDRMYENLCCIHKKYKSILLNILWGYLYYNEKVNLTNLLRDKIKQITNEKKKNIISKIIKQKTENFSKEKNNNLHSLFNYNKALDKYESQKNKNIEQLDKDEIDITKNLDVDNVLRSHTNTQLSMFNIINNTWTKESENKRIKNKKFLYKEWDFKINNYKKNWCNVFEKKENYKLNSKEEIEKIENNITTFKEEIFLLKNKFKMMYNKKNWIIRQTSGQEIDFDSIVDNYKQTKEENFNKIYKYKKNANKDICLLVMLDSSLSTDGYINDNKIINVIKDITLIMTCGINLFIEYLSITAFYSNTRHDCSYVIIKDFIENFEKAKYNLTKINPIGYTRIGPAIRHSIFKINKIKSKCKIILIISDGKPTDYDEYEGFYGINDIKKTIHESKMKNIKIKSLIINEQKKIYFENIFGKNNCYLLSKQKKIHKKLIKIFADIIN